MIDDLRSVLPLRLAYAFATEHGLEKEVNEIRDMEIEWDSSYTSTVRRGYIVELFEKAGVFVEFKSLHWPSGLTPRGEAYSRRCIEIKRRFLDFLAGREPGDGSDEGGEATLDEISNVSFELERQLRDFIAHNLQAIPVRGQRLSLYVNSDGRSGMEYPTAVGPIDILAVDREGNFVVFELKRATSPDHAIGQLTRYMGWVKHTIAKDRNVYGVIVAREIRDNLRYALEVLPNVSLFEYKVQFQLLPANEFQP